MFDDLKARQPEGLDHADSVFPSVSIRVHPWLKNLRSSVGHRGHEARTTEEAGGAQGFDDSERDDRDGPRTSTTATGYSHPCPFVSIRG